MKKHFVTFYSPGTIIAEQITKEIDSWDVAKARKMADEIVERYNAIPFGFRFSTRERGPSDFDSKLTEQSEMHYINCKVETLSDIKARKDPRDETLIQNMEINGWNRIARTIKGGNWCLPIEEKDVVLG